MAELQRLVPTEVERGEAGRAREGEEPVAGQV